MKKFLLTAALTIATIFVVSPVALANPQLIQGCEGTAAASAICRDQAASPDNPLFGKSGIITRATSLLATITGILSVFYISISGLKYVTSGGDASKTKSAREGIIYASVGIGITLVAGTIVQFVLSRL
jgi:hypothetical protein